MNEDEALPSERIISRASRFTFGRKTLRNYHNIRKIGSGTYGDVYQAVDLETGEIVAIKKVKG